MTKTAALLGIRRKVAAAMVVTGVATTDVLASRQVCLPVLDTDELLQAYDAQRERIAALEAMLRQMEWTPLVDAIDGEDLTACPVCGQRKAWGHASDCGLAALLKEAQV